MNLTNNRVNSLADSSIVLGHVRWAIGRIGPPCRVSENTISFEIYEKHLRFCCVTNPFSMLLW
jgi:hypothetical protein